MTGKGHQAIGLILTAPCYYLITNMGFSYIPGLLCSIGVFCGAKAPDYLEITYGLGKGRRSIFRHRGITHWWALWLIPLIMIYSALLSINGQKNSVYDLLINNNIYLLNFQNIEYFYFALLGFLIGGISHILTDLPNKRGVPIFTPFDSFSLNLWESGKFEKTIIFLVSLGSIYYINLFNIKNIIWN